MKKKINERIDWLLFRMAELQETQTIILKALVDISEEIKNERK